VVPQALGQNISVLLDFNGLAVINFWIYCCGRIDRCHAETVIYIYIYIYIYWCYCCYIFLFLYLRQRNNKTCVLQQTWKDGWQ
jgi:hypothetical protein